MSSSVFLIFVLKAVLATNPLTSEILSLISLIFELKSVLVTNTRHFSHVTESHIFKNLNLRSKGA